jgi:tetratricopeptide (TPR) repeat protein
MLVATVLHNLGSSYTASHRYREAQSAFDEASELARKSGQANDRFKGELQNSVGVLYFYEGKFRKAESHFRDASAIYSNSKAPMPASLGQTVNNLAEVYRQKHQFEKAEEAYQRAIALIEEELGPKDPDLVVILGNLADVNTGLGRHQEAEKLFLRSLDILENLRPLLTTRMIHNLNGLGKTYLQMNRPAAAAQVFAQAVELSSSGSRRNPEVADVLENYSRTLNSMGERQQALEFHFKANRARRIYEFNGTGSGVTVISLGIIKALALHGGLLSECNEAWRRFL